MIGPLIHKRAKMDEYIKVYLESVVLLLLLLQRIKTRGVHFEKRNTLPRVFIIGHSIFSNMSCASFYIVIKSNNLITF